MKKNCDASIQSKIEKIQNDKVEVKQGDFFFASFVTNDGKLRERPIFVAGNKGNDNEDIIICSCTTSPARNVFDKKVQLRKETYVRTNKIYTIRKADLLFKIPQQASPLELKEIIGAIQECFDQ